MKQLTIQNLQHKKLASTRSFIMLYMQNYHTAAELKELSQYVEEYQKEGIIVTLQQAEPANYTSYHQKILERLQASK